GPLDERGAALASAAASRLTNAGRRAFARGDLPAAANLLTRAVSALPEEDAGRPEVLSELGGILTDTGSWHEAEDVLGQAIHLAMVHGDRRSEGLATVRMLWIQEHSGHFASNQDALPELDRVVAMFDALGDDQGLADAWILRGHIEFWSGRAER